MAKKYNYDVLGQRIVAHILDNTIEVFGGAIVFFALYLLFLLVLLIFSGFRGIGIFPEPLIILGMIFFVWVTVCIVLFFNNMYLVKKYGASIGKLIMGLSIMDDKGRNLNYGPAFVRIFIKILVFMFSIFGLIFYLIVITQSKKKQGPPDHVIGSYVVEKKASRKKKKK